MPRAAVGALGRAQVDLVADYIEVHLAEAITLDSLAELVGFSNLSHFRRLFVAQFGIRPGDLRSA